MFDFSLLFVFIGTQEGNRRFGFSKYGNQYEGELRVKNQESKIMKW